MSATRYGWGAFLPEIVRVVDSDVSEQDVKIHTVHAAQQLCDMLGGLQYEHDYILPRTLDYGEVFTVPLPTLAGMHVRNVVSVKLDGEVLAPAGNAKSYASRYEQRGNTVVVHATHNYTDAVDVKIGVTVSLYIEAGNVQEEMPPILYEKYNGLMFNLLIARVHGEHTNKGRSALNAANLMVNRYRAQHAASTGRTKLVGNTRRSW